MQYFAVDNTQELQLRLQQPPVVVLQLTSAVQQLQLLPHIALDMNMPRLQLQQL
jgi:hypothetical protein